jgi:hypothetical protein
MSSRYGPELLVGQYVDVAAAGAHGMVSTFMEDPRNGTTPIERLLMTSLLVQMNSMWRPDQLGYWRIVRLQPNEGRDEVRRREDPIHPLDILLVEQQVQLPDIGRVDFLFHAYAEWFLQPEPRPPACWRSLIVECDGHDFHERTKEQAANDRSRDRAAMLAGFEVFRFTGSELWRDPWGCGKQIYDWADKGL